MCNFHARFKDKNVTDVVVNLIFDYHSLELQALFVLQRILGVSTCMF